MPTETSAPTQRALVAWPVALLVAAGAMLVRQGISLAQQPVQPPAADAGNGDASAEDAAPDAEGGAPADASVAPAPVPALVPPRALAPARPRYPDDGAGRRADVELLLTLDEQGAVRSLELVRCTPADSPPSFEQSARVAAEALRFSPALREGVAVSSRVRYRVVVSPPAFDLTAVSESEPQGAANALPDAAAPEASDASLEAPVDASADASADAAAAPAPAPVPDGPDLRVVGNREPETRAASDFYALVGGLRNVPRNNASDLLRLAPGIMLTNQGGEGHPEQVFLRGFDAREGQDLEFTVNGVPINEAGNAHGEGLADTHFILPELVRAVRVLEGPFDPHQGNYAVAGSAEYQLGLDQRGVTMQYQGGSFNTHRFLALWGPSDMRRGTFAGGDLRTTDGFGSNRAARLARAMGQLELLLGSNTVLQLLAGTYVTQYSSAGVVRQDDYQAGRIDFFGTYDPTQGGDSSRHFVSATVEDARAARTLRQQLFVTVRNMRLRENYTGFLEDPAAPYRSGVAQRGDLVDQSFFAVTVGGRGSARFRTHWRGLQQSFEVGYYARFDQGDSAQRRLRFGTVVPYRTDFDLTNQITNIGLYLDSELRPARWLTFRGGVRGDFYGYNVENHCDLHDTTLSAGRTPVDSLCYDVDRAGPRDPTARRSASGLVFQPRASVVVGPWAGVAFQASFGMGSRAADPTYLADGNQAPFSPIYATEGGVTLRRQFGPVSLDARALYYFTYASRDLIFNQQEGRNTLAPGTLRQGALVAARASAGFFDIAASATFADARFVRTTMDPGATYFPPDQGDRVPYVPSWVVRVDAAAQGPIPWTWLAIAGYRFSGRVGLGFSYISPRSLPYNEWSNPIAVLDASAGLRWRWFELGVSAQNITDQRYRQGEYNYASDFRPNAGLAPSLLPARQFTAGAPASVLGTLTVYLGERAGDNQP